MSSIVHASLFFGLILLMLDNLSAITNYRLGGQNGNIRIYLINLDRRHERFEHCDRQLRYFGLNYTRFAAYDSHAFKNRDYNHIREQHPDMKWNLTRYLNDPGSCKDQCGAVGCWLSHVHVHLMIMDEAKRGIDGPVLILEDDIHILPDAIQKIDEAINTLPPSWELFAVGYKNEYCSGPVAHTTVDWKNAPDSPRYCRARLFLDTHAYILHNSTAVAHFLEYENNGKYDAIDLIWVPLNENLLVESYLLKPGRVILQNKDLASDITPGKEKESMRRVLRASK